MQNSEDEFIDAFNEELDQYACGARVRRPTASQNVSHVYTMQQYLTYAHDHGFM